MVEPAVEVEIVHARHPAPEAASWGYWLHQPSGRPAVAVRSANPVCRQQHQTVPVQLGRTSYRAAVSIQPVEQLEIHLSISL